MDKPAQNKTIIQTSNLNSVSIQNLKKAGIVLLMIFLVLGALATVMIIINNNIKGPQSALSPKSTSEQNEAINVSGVNVNYALKGVVVDVDRENKILKIKSVLDNKVYPIKITDKTIFTGGAPGLPAKVVDGKIVYPTGSVKVKSTPFDFQSINLESWITVEVDGHSDSKLPEAISLAQIN